MVSTSSECNIALHPQATWDRRPLAIVFQTREQSPEKSGSFLIIEGWTRMLAGRRMLFECEQDLVEDQLCVFMDHPESNHRFFEIRILERWEAGNDVFRYEAQFIRLLTPCDLETDMPVPKG